MALNVGEKAPEFTLTDADRKQRSLKELLGKKTLLVFFPGAFTGVCTKEMCALRDSLSTLNTLNATIIGVSVDSPFANKAFSAENKLQFPILSDHSRSVSKQYGGLYNDFAGIPGYTAAKRSLFILDKNGIVKYVWVTENPGVEPNYEEVMNALELFS